MPALVGCGASLGEGETGDDTVGEDWGVWVGAAVGFIEVGCGEALGLTTKYVVSCEPQ